jgi:hypothetical protein
MNSIKTGLTIALLLSVTAATMRKLKTLNKTVKYLELRHV